MPTVDRTRMPGTRLATSNRVSVLGKPPLNQQNSGAIDHWSIVLVYSLGFGTLAVCGLCLLLLIVVGLYGEFVWVFTYWDLASVRLTPFKGLIYLLIAGTFAGGTCVGLWCFSGAAWKKRSSATVRRRR